MKLLEGLYFFTFIIIFLYAWIRLRKAGSIKLILPLLCIRLITESVAEYLNIIDRNNLFLFHILTPVEYLLYSAIFILNIEMVLVKRVIFISIPVFFVLAFIFTFYIEGIEYNNSYAVIMGVILLTLWSILYFHELIWKRPDTEIRSNPLFWICVGLLFHNTGNLFTIGPLNYLMRQNMDLAAKVYSLSYIFSFIFFISLILASYHFKKEASS